MYERRIGNVRIVVHDAAQQDLTAQIGTPIGHYAPPAQGPFACINCIHFTHTEGTPMGRCDHPEVIKDAKAGYLKLIMFNGREFAEVHHEGCSDWFNPGPLKPTSTAHM